VRGGARDRADARRALTISVIVAAAVARLGVRVVAARLRSLPESRASIGGRTACEALIRLGPTFIKIGQILSTRADLVAPDAIAHLRRLTDDVPPAPVAALRSEIEQSLGAPPEALFAWISSEPLASASMACVFHATTRTGQEVAVKVRRPKVADVIERDLRLLQALAGVGSVVPGLRSIPVRDVTTEVGGCVRRQLDFGREADVQRRLRAALSPDERVVVPRVVDDLTGGSVITMDLVHELVDDSGPQPPCREALFSALNALYRMIFVEGLVHCDLHGGNLRFLPDGSVVLLDFGFAAALSQEDRLRFAEFFYALAVDDGERAAEVTLELASSVPVVLDREAFVREVADLVAAASGQAAASFSVARFAGGMFAIQRRHRVRGSVGFVMAIVALLVLEGVVLEHIPDLDFQDRAKPFILRASIRRIDRLPQGVEALAALASRSAPLPD
jgi:ubiquinone biosynthesis protein